jgi:hypothetical protein
LWAPLERLGGAIACGVRPLVNVALAVSRAPRLRGAWTLVALALVAVAIIPGLAGPPWHGRVAAVRADDVTASLNKLRTGWDPGEPKLSPSVVGGGTFNRVFSTAVNGQVYAQPIVVGSTLIVATENDWVYGLNAATGAVKWSRSLGTPYTITWCGDLAPHIGLTSTPVYDPANGMLYVLGQTLTNGSPSWHLFGIDANTGRISLKKPIDGSPTNDPNIKFRPKYELARPGLLLTKGTVYGAFGAHCDVQPYAGYVVGVNVSTKASTLWTDESGVTDDQAGIWQGGGGLMSDGPGRIFFTSGNGVSPAPGAGNSPPGQLAESTVRLALQSNGSLAAQDFFSPADAPSLDASDIDFGSGGPVGVPFGTATYPDLLVQAGKDGRVFLVNRDNLGGREQGAGGTDAALSSAGPYAGQWGHPAVFADTTTLTAANASAASDFVYYVGNSDYLRVLKAQDSSTDTPALSDVANSSFTFGYTSGSPVITSNGTSPSSAVLWEVQSSGATGKSSSLDAFLAVPSKTCTGTSPCSLTPIWSAPIGTASKFTIPATSNGMVYVGTRGGHVLGFGVTSTAPLAGTAPTSFGQTAVGSRTASDVTVTARRDVTVAGVSTSSAVTPRPFKVLGITEAGSGAARRPAKFPVRLHRGDKLKVAVSFAPGTPGGAPGSLEFHTDSSTFRLVNVPLYGRGTKPGLYATSTSLLFQQVLNDGLTVRNVPVGVPLPKIVDLVNGGTSPEKVTTVRGPARPFSARDLPTRGTVIQPGQAVPVEVVFRPTRATSSSSSLTVRTSTGTSATVSLGGRGLAPVSKFKASPGSVNFGTVKVGRTTKVWIGITSLGNEPATMKGASRPTVPFGAPYSVTKGLPVNGDSDLKIPIVFKPTRVGRFAGSYRLTWSDRLGTHTLVVPLSGAASR